MPKEKPKPTIITDTREQNPWVFSDKVNHICIGLKTGDYSLDGYQDQIVIERKSLDDYVGSIMDSFREDDQSEGRFFRELDRMELIPHRAIVIEQPFCDLLLGRYESQVSSAAIMSKTMSFEIKRGISVMFFDNRNQAAIWTEEYLSKFWRIKQDEMYRWSVQPKRTRANKREDYETVPEGIIPGWCK